MFEFGDGGEIGAGVINLELGEIGGDQETRKCSCMFRAPGSPGNL